MKFFSKISLIISVTSFAFLSSVKGQIINLTEDTIDGVAVSDSGIDAGAEDVIGGYLDDGFIRRTLQSDNFGSGSGGFRDLYKIQDSSTATDPQDGYNRTGAFPDISIPGGFDPLLTVGDLTSSSEADSYIFAFDTHESAGGTEEYISLDSLQIYVGSSTDPSPLPNTVADLGDLGTLVYDMDADGDTYVLIDSSLFAGSGQMDLFAFIPTTRFDGFAADSYVYVFTSWGMYSFDDLSRTQGFATSATPENVASASEAFASYGVVPEPSSALLLAFAGLFWILRRPVRRVRA